MSSPVSMLFTKHLNNYMHMASHALGEFQHSNSFHNLGLTLSSKRVGHNLLRISPMVQGLITHDYHLSFQGLLPSPSSVSFIHGLITNLCFNPRPLSLNPHSLALIRFMSTVKSRVVPNPTLRLAT